MPYREPPRLARAALRTCLAALLLPVAAAAAAPATETSTHPMGGAGATVLERVPDPPAAPRSQRIVFTCVTPGLTTFSDRPCGPLPERREIEWVATTGPAAGEAATVVPRRAAASTRPAAATGRRDADPTRTVANVGSCEALRHAAAAIDRQMRAGYSAREAPRLWERWRAARDRLRAAGCR